MLEENCHLTTASHCGKVNLQAVGQQGFIFPDTGGGRVHTHRRMCPRSLRGLQVVVGGVRPLWLFDEFDGLDHGSLFSVYHVKLPYVFSSRSGAWICSEVEWYLGDFSK